MEIAIWIISYLAAVGLCFIFYFLNLKKWTAVIWAVVVTVILVALGVSLLVRKEEAAELRSEEGVLIPSNEPTPANPCDPDVPEGATILLFGTSAAFILGGPRYVIINVAGEDLLAIEQSNSGEVLKSAILRSSDERLVARIENNQFRINPNNYFALTRPDRHTLTVVDQEGNRSFHVRYLNPQAISFIGTFRSPGHQPIVIGEDEMQYRSMTMRGNCFGGSGTIIRLP